VLLVDTSTSMRWGSRMEIVRRALAGLPELLGREDRISLVTFSQTAHVLVENLGAEAFSQLRAVANSLTADGATNFLGGFSEASSVAHEAIGSGRPAVRMVLLTDGLLDLDPAAAESLQKQAADAARQKIRLDVMDLGQQQKDADPQLAALAQAGRGGIYRATSAEQMRSAFREIVTGRSQQVARGARLHVTFNPKAVLEYRIIGHEATEWAGMLPGSLEADFHEGQAATGLFELRLAPNAPDDVAHVELTWYAPGGNGSPAEAPMKETGVAHRGQFSAALASSPPWLQQAALAAFTSEVLRHSPFIFPPRGGVSVPTAWRRAHELSQTVDRRLHPEPSYQELVDLIDRETKAHPAKGKIN
jgi:Ca-activated chloride channel homolog